MMVFDNSKDLPMEFRFKSAVDKIVQDPISNYISDIVEKSKYLFDGLEKNVYRGVFTFHVCVEGKYVKHSYKTRGEYETHYEAREAAKLLYRSLQSLIR